VPLAFARFPVFDIDKSHVVDLFENVKELLFANLF
jgi:hypothetical protein